MLSKPEQELTVMIASFSRAREKQRDLEQARKANLKQRASYRRSGIATKRGATSDNGPRGIILIGKEGESKRR